MIIPSLLDSQMVDKDGRFTPQAHMYFQQLVSQLQQIITPGGVVLPQQTTTTIGQFNNSLNGTIIYDNVAHKGLLNENGTFKTIQTA